MTTTSSQARRRPSEAGFVISTEILLMSVLLVIGLATGWVVMRDQSLAEITDTISAIDAYLLGTRDTRTLAGTRWIANGTVLDPSTRVVTDSWGTSGSGTGLEWVTVEETSPGVYQQKDGVLVYGAAGTE